MVPSLNPVPGLVPSKDAQTGTNEDEFRAFSERRKSRRVKPFRRKVASCNALGKLPPAGFEPAAYGLGTYIRNPNQQGLLSS